MTVEWLNAEKTRAIVTKGWLRRRWAEVERGYESWRFVSGGGLVSSWLYWRLETARDRALSPWQPVASLPNARLLAKESQCA